MPRPRNGPDKPDGPADGSEGSPDDHRAAAGLLAAAGLILRSTRDSNGGEIWTVSGNTLDHRALLREAGGRWNRVDACWEFVGTDPTQAIAAQLAALPPRIGDNSGGEEKPHYHGHRERVRQRVLSSGVEPLQDYELLELLLFYAIPRKDTKPLAKRLLERFHTLGDVLAADAVQLREFEIDRPTQVMFRAIRETGARLARKDVLDRPLIGSWDKLIDYCRTSLQHEKTEQFRILFLDRKNVLIRDEVQQRGTVDHTPVYPREVVKRALELGASAIVMVHNHPSGDPTPSREDIAMTKEVKAAAQVLGIELHDHLVVGRSGHTSFRSKGLL